MNNIVAVICCCISLHLIAVSSQLYGPLHASCQLDWSVGSSCADAGDKIVSQIKKWSGEDCGDGEKCRYSLDSYAGGVLKAKHTTPVHKYVDDLMMVFRNASGPRCNIHANSTSETWYAVLDYSTNYCNLHNLITGSGLDKSAGFKEVTSDKVCTQYSSANCDKY